VPASAWRLRRLRPPSMVIVLRRLEVGATVKGREALPHGRSVADCPLLPPSRRLAQPGRHDGIGRGARAHSLHSFIPEEGRSSFPLGRRRSDSSAERHAPYGTTGAPLTEAVDLVSVAIANSIGLGEPCPIVVEELTDII
jgi:hypothetical protein